MFNKKQKRELAKIANLDISRCDIFELQAALKNNLNYVSQINEINLEGIEPLVAIEEEL